MKKLVVAGALALAAAACGKKSGAGTLDDRALMDLQKDVMGAKFEDAVAATEKLLGPARAKDAVDWEYAVLQGDTCFHFGLMKGDDGTVHGVQNGSFKNNEGMFADCEKLAKSPPAK